MKNAKKLEAFRLNLNHDLLKNQFLNKMGNARRDLSLRERSHLCLETWKDPRGKKDTHYTVIRETVNQGLQCWPRLAKALYQFFYVQPEDCGFRVTQRFRKARTRLFRGEDAKVAVLQKFVDDFERLAGASEQTQLERLAAFWEAADDLHSELHHMRLSAAPDAMFGDYFQKKVTNRSGGNIMNDRLDILFVDDEWCQPRERAVFQAAYGSLVGPGSPFRFHYVTAETGPGTYGAQPVLATLGELARPGAVFLDLKFGSSPTLGLDILRAIRKRYSTLPVFVLTSWEGETDLVDQALALGATQYLVKKPTLEELKNVLKTWISKEEDSNEVD